MRATSESDLAKPPRSACRCRQRRAAPNCARMFGAIHGTLLRKIADTSGDSRHRTFLDCDRQAVDSDVTAKRSTFFGAKPRMTPDVSLAAAFLAGLVSFLSPCVLPLVPGYISMLSGIGMEQLRQGQPPRAGLFASSLAFVVGFSVVFISFGASASAVGSFLRENRNTLAPIAGALILLFGLHLLGILIKLTVRTSII